MASAQNSSVLAALPRTQEKAAAMLGPLASDRVDALEGPVQVGNLRDMRTQRGAEELAKHYLSAIHKGSLVLPYFAGKSR
jgi:hypothetical protein